MKSVQTVIVGEDGRPTYIQHVPVPSQKDVRFSHIRYFYFHLFLDRGGIIRTKEGRIARQICERYVESAVNCSEHSHGISARETAAIGNIDYHFAEVFICSLRLLWISAIRINDYKTHA